MIRFNQYHVLDTETGIKARVRYSLDNRVDGRKCVTIYAKDYCGTLGRIIPDAYRNDTDSMTDYFETGAVRLFEDHPLYAAARSRAEAILAKRHEKIEAMRSIGRPVMA